MPHVGSHVKGEYEIRVKEEPGIPVKETPDSRLKEIAVEVDF